jgi:hypothetical protein
VHLKDGMVLEESVDAPRGSEQNFPSAPDVIAKFRKLAGHSLPSSRLDQIIDLTLSLDMLSDIAPLIGALALLKTKKIVMARARGPPR